MPVIEVIYNETATTDRTLRNPALAVVMAYASDLLKPQSEDAGPTPLAQLMKTIPELGVDITLGLVLAVEKLKSATPATPKREEIQIGDKVKCGCGALSVVHMQHLNVKCYNCDRFLFHGRIIR